MKRLLVLTLATAALAACQNDPVEPKPIEKPLPAVAKITYATDAALIFTSKVVPIRRLVKAFDSAGNELPSSRLAFVLPGSWSIRNDSIIAPSSENAGTFRAYAKPIAGGATFDHAPGHDSAFVTSGIDLRQYNWTATYTCSQPKSVSVVRTSDNTPIDSVQYTSQVDSVAYAGADSSFIRNYGGVGTIFWTGSGIRFLRDGRRDTIQTADPIPLARQAPDSLVFDPSYTGADKLLAVRSAGPTFVYAGGSWCKTEWSYGTRGPVTLARGNAR